jgi:hypothetical protein
MSENRMTTDTERGRKLLEARRDRIVTHTNVEPVGIDEFRAFLDLALAADRRRQAEDQLIAVKDNKSAHAPDYGALLAAHTAVTDAHGAVNDSLDALLAHLAGGGRHERSATTDGAGMIGDDRA